MDNLEAAIQNGFNQVAANIQTRLDQAVVNIQTSFEQAINVQGAMIDHVNESMHERFDEVIALLGGGLGDEGEQGGSGDEGEQGGSDGEDEQGGSDEEDVQGGSDDEDEQGGSDDEGDDDGDEGGQPMFVCTVAQCGNAYHTQNALNAHGRAHLKQCPFCLGWFRNLITHKPNCPVPGPNRI